MLFAGLPDYLRLPFSIGYFSGMREGEEILGLDWSQVDVLRGVTPLRACETKNDEAREFRPCRNSGRCSSSGVRSISRIVLMSASGSDGSVMPSRFRDSGRHGILLASEHGSERWSLRLTGSLGGRFMRIHVDRIRSRRQRWSIEE